MVLEDISSEYVIRAIDQFDDIGEEEMLDEYGGGPSTIWYILYKGKCYDQKLICRAAHYLQYCEYLPSGPGTFRAHEARNKLSKLGFEVVEYNECP